MTDKRKSNEQVWREWGFPSAEETALENFRSARELRRVIAKGGMLCKQCGSSCEGVGTHELYFIDSHGVEVLYGVVNAD